MQDQATPKHAHMYPIVQFTPLKQNKANHMHLCQRSIEECYAHKGATGQSWHKKNHTIFTRLKVDLLENLKRGGGENRLKLKRKYSTINIGDTNEVSGTLWQVYNFIYALRLYRVACGHLAHLELYYAPGTHGSVDSWWKGRCPNYCGTATWNSTTSGGDGSWRKKWHCSCIVSLELCLTHVTPLSATLYHVLLSCFVKHQEGPGPSKHSVLVHSRIQEGCHLLCQRNKQLHGGPQDRRFGTGGTGGSCSEAVFQLLPAML